MEKLQPKLRFPEFKGDWAIKKLDDLCSMQAGKFISASDINDANEEYIFPCYGGNGLRGFTKSFNYEGQYSLIGRQGALCGNITLAIDKFHATEHAVVVTVNQNIDTLWMYYLLNILNLNQYATGQAQPGLSVQNIKQVEAKISNSLLEQTKIATFLSVVDEKLNLLKEKKALLEDYKKGMMQKIFSQELRFKDENGKDFSDWEEKTISEICTKKSSNISANKIEENFGEFIFYGASGVLKKVDFFREENDYVSIVKDGAGVGRLLYCKGKSSVLGTLEIISPKVNLDTYFLFCLLSNIDFTKYVTGSTIPHIYFKDYSLEKCGVPCIEEQTKIASFLSAIDEKMELVTQQIEDTQMYKKGLLQQMFC